MLRCQDDDWLSWRSRVQGVQLFCLQLLMSSLRDTALKFQLVKTKYSAYPNKLWYNSTNQTYLDLAKLFSQAEGFKKFEYVSLTRTKTKGVSYT